MQCPACRNTLSHVQVSDIEVDVCKNGCGGLWFDKYEFQKFDEPHEQAGKELLAVDRAPGVQVDHSEKRPCPRCDGFTMMRNFFSVKKEVEIDTCAGCAGVWLDPGELAHIHSLFGSEEERKQEAKETFDDLFGPRLEALAQEQKERNQNARRIANMFRFICPSYYIPGDQEWGAF
jgi:Zn-finger nucleic acid-binding protein